MKKYLVGGAIRDNLLKIDITERDWVVTGTTPQEMLKNGYQQVGKKFPVFLHPKNHEEHALARTEHKSGYGYNGFIYYTSPEVTLEQDLYRRDLTINAIAQDEQGQIIDPYQGQLDIHKRQLRHISNSFCEDPLRVLRVARFAARFAHLNFNIAPETLTIMKKMTDELSFLTPERIWKETEKALLTNNPQIYFQVLYDCGALKKIFPEINALFGIPTLTEWNYKIDSGAHTLITLMITSLLTNNIIVRFASLCHDLGKTLTPHELWPTHIKHGQNGKKIIEILCKRLKIPNQLQNLAKMAAEYHDMIHNSKKLTSTKIINFFNNIDVWRKPERLEQILIISEANARGYKEFKKKTYSQSDFMRTAFNVANSITAKHIIAKGFAGKEISIELSLKRKNAISYWKKNF